MIGNRSERAGWVGPQLTEKMGKSRSNRASRGELTESIPRSSKEQGRMHNVRHSERHVREIIEPGRGGIILGIFLGISTPALKEPGKDNDHLEFYS